MLPESIGRLQQLIHLDLGNNQLSNLSESIGQLQRLTSLDLYHNRLLELPESISQLQQLTNLNLGNNWLSKLTELIGQLQQLTYLDLSSNRLSELPDGIGDLNDLRDLQLYGNPLSNALAAAASSGTYAVLDHLGTRGTRLYEAKLLIVGEAGAGKTTLARKLIDPAAHLPGENESTLGINMDRDWRFPLSLCVQSPGVRVDRRRADVDDVRQYLGFRRHGFRKRN